MNRLFDVLLGLLVAIFAVALLGYGYAWWTSAQNFSQRYDAPLMDISPSDDPAVIAEGERLARTRGCFWCHGADLQGTVYYVAGIKGVRSIAPNLTWKARDYTTAEFVRALRSRVLRSRAARGLMIRCLLTTRTSATRGRSGCAAPTM